MLTIHKDNITEESITLKLEGEATVENASELQNELISGMQEHQKVMVNCEKLSGIDFFTLQLLCSAHRTSMLWEKLLCFDGTSQPAVNEAVHLTGFARDSGCALCPEHLRCMWVEADKNSSEGVDHA